MSDNQVKLEVFEGPLDLLLYLVRKEEVDIYEVNLTRIATQFVEYVDLMRDLDLDIAGEFLVMASTLMYIKSRELLPVDQQAEVEDDDDENDPRYELIRQLVEYKKFKDAAASLQTREAEQENIYARLPGKLEFEAEGPALRPQVSLFDLIGAVNNILKRHTARDPSRDIYGEQFSVSEKMENLMTRMQSGSKLKFSDLFEQASTRLEIVVTFLALLELIRLKQLQVRQPEPFEEIEIVAAPPAVMPLQEEDENLKGSAPTESAPAADARPTAESSDAASAPQDAPSASEEMN